MRLAGEDELHRALGVVHHGREFLDIGQNQIGALVGGKAAGEADGERVRTEHAAQPLQHFRRFAAALGLLHGPVAHKVQQPRFQVEMRFPEFAVVHVLDALPDFGLAAVLLPAGSEMTVVETKHLRRQPGRNVHAVGDVPDGNFVLGLARNRGRSTSRATPRRAERRRHWRAAKASGRARSCRNPRWVLPGFSRPSSIRRSDGNTERFAQRSQVLFDQFGVEAVVAGGTRACAW